MKITTLALIATATVSAAIVLLATAYADCTDSCTGQFFRVSRDSRQLGW